MPLTLIVRPRASRLLSSFYRAGGITALASRLRREGIDAEIVDLAFDELPDFDAIPDPILLLSLYIDDFGEGLAIATSAKSVNPATRVVIGGPHVSLLGADAHDISAAIDVVALGDCLGEAVSLLRRNGVGAEPPPRIIGALGAVEKPQPDEIDYAVWPEGRYFDVFPIEFSRGCPHRCPFCTDPVLRNSTAMSTSALIVDLFRRVAALQPTACVRFTDSSFTSMQPSLDELLQKLADDGTGIRWGAYAYPSDIDASLARRLQKAGCIAVFLGIESLTPGAITGKRITRDYDRVKDAVNTLRDYGIFTHCNFIVGLPGETSSTFRRTMDRVEALNADSIGGGPFYLTPGSTFHRNSERFGITIFDPEWSLKQHDNFGSNATYFRTATLSQGEMRDLATEFRERVEAMTTTVWNMSDYPLLCWVSAGGDVDDLKVLWRSSAPSPDATMVRDVLREKTGVTLKVDACRTFVQRTACIAADMRRSRAVGNELEARA